MRIRNNEELTFREACGLLASQNGSENLQRKIDTLEWLLNHQQELTHYKLNPQAQRLRERATIAPCVECGSATHITERKQIGEDEVCQDCHYAISGYMED